MLPIVLALLVTIGSRMKWRDKWSVCIMCADTLAAEICTHAMASNPLDERPPLLHAPPSGFKFTR